MNFYNDEEKKAGAPVIPGAASPFKKTSAFGRSPMFSRAAGSIFDRLKNLSRRDMAFVGIGLSILVMAPVAEYMMSQPEESNLLKPNAFAGPGRGPLDTGLGGFSPGSTDGNGEVITPLSSRDPASLILGAQSAQPVLPPASSTPPPQSNWRDAVKDAGREAFSAAAKTANPTNIPKMGGALRGLFGGGESSRTSGSLSGGKIIEDAKSAPNQAAKRSMVGPVAMAGYKGVASNTPNSASKGAFEKLRSQADKSAGYFSGGSGMNSLDKAAAEAVNVGAGLGGAGGLGEGDKTTKPSNSNNKYEHNRSGETLEEMAAKQRMQKALEWEFFKKYEIPKQIINAVVGAVSKWMGDQVTGMLSPGSAPAEYVCLGKIKDKDSAGAELSCHLGDGTYNNAKIISRSTDQKTIDNWNGANSAKLCPCGVLRASEFKPTGGAPAGGTTNTTGTGAGAGQQTAPIADAELLKEFDTELLAILRAVKTTVDKKDDTAKLQKSTKEIAEGVARLLTGRDADKQLPGMMRGLDATVSDFNGKVQNYGSDLDSAEIALNNADATVSQFVTDAQAILNPGAAQDKYAATVLNKEGAEAVKGQTSGTVFQNVSIRLGSAKDLQQRLAIARKDLAFQRKAQGFFKGQGPAMNTEIGDITNTANTLAAQALAARDKAAAVKPEDLAKPEGKAAVEAAFADLWGGDKAALQGVLAMRGATADIKANKLDDSAEITKENTMWKKISPRIAMDTKAAKDAYTGDQGELSKTMIAGFKRGKAELPPAIDGMTAEPKNSIGAPAQTAIDAIAGYRTELKMGGGTTPSGTNGGNASTNISSGPPVNNGGDAGAQSDASLVGRQTALLADARNVASDYDAAKSVYAKLGSGTNAQYARSDYRKMTDAQANVARLASELQTPGAKPTKEKLDEMAMYVSNFNKSYGDFQAHARASGVPVAHSQPTVVINNNVSASSTAGATTTVKPTTVNNTTVVKPPKPEAKPLPPKPAPMSFILGAYTMSTAGNGGDTVVYKSGRGLTAPLPFLNVTCSRKDKDTFVVTAATKDYIAWTTPTAEYNGRVCR